MNFSPRQTQLFPSLCNMERRITPFWPGLLLLISTELVEAQYFNAPDPELEATMADIRQRRRDRIPAIDTPSFVTATSADSFMAPGDLVIGLQIVDEVRAYPVMFLQGREVVNDSLRGGPITVTW